MVEEQVSLTNEKGMNGEMATRFVQIASQYTSKIAIMYDDKDVNAKSIMSLLTMAIAPGEAFTIRARGEDEQRALSALVRFIQTGEEADYDFHGSGD